MKIYSIVETWTSGIHEGTVFTWPNIFANSNRQLVLRLFDYVPHYLDGYLTPQAALDSCNSCRIDESLIAEQELRINECIGKCNWADNEFIMENGLTGAFTVQSLNRIDCGDSYLTVKLIKEIEE